MAPADRAEQDAAGLLDRALSGSVRAIARLVSWAETGGADGAAVARAAVGRPRTAAVLGITGAPGAGKSTLTDAIVAELRAGPSPEPVRVAVLAVDPASPFTGGALLGDRVRMARHATDPSVFIRSLSSRGHLGGMSAGTPAVVDVLSAMGFDVVIIETVGVGQSEVDVMHLADTVVVVLAPGMGDGVQAAKAGILEIADLLVVNKADHEGARSAVRDLQAMVRLGGATEWPIPVLATVASTGEGVAELVAAARRHREHLAGTGRLAEHAARRIEAAIESVVVARLRGALRAETGRATMRSAAEHVADGALDHVSAADEVLGWLADRIATDGTPS